MSRARVLIVGCGGREHALAWKLSQSPDIERLWVAPGNAGTEAVCQNLPIVSTDVSSIVRFVDEHDIDLAVVGPEAPLAVGLADRLRERGRRVFGPDAACARLETSKAFAKGVMERVGVPSSPYRVFDNAAEALEYLPSAQYPLAVKADALAAGKGVFMCGDEESARAAVYALMVDRALGTAGARVVIEEALDGVEVSILALVDGGSVVALPAAQDHKRLLCGGRGPNTGGMGAVAPVPWLGTEERDRLVDATIRPVAEAMVEAGRPYRGVLYAGLMLTAKGPYVLEYNCRLGDPEAQVILPLLDGDLFPWLNAVAAGELCRAAHQLRTVPATAVGVVLAAPGYPDAPTTGALVQGLEEVPEDLLVFHGGTVREGDTVKSAGGRVLTVVGRGATLEEARQRAYSSPIHFPDLHFRRDVGRPHDPTLPRIGVLASGEGSNLQALLDAVEAGEIGAEVAVVVSSHAPAGTLARARQHGVPAIAVPLPPPRRDRCSRLEYDRRLLDHLLPFDLDLLVLAGWMYVLSPEFLNQCPCPVINVHPSLLTADGSSELEVDGTAVPVLRGLKAVSRAVALGLTSTGVTVHRVTPEVDVGPIIQQEPVPVLSGDCEESLYQRIKPVEHRLLVSAVQAMLSERA
jgi:phosphoribosylamine--glycine ligase